jgi:Transposase DDE domain
MGTNIDKESDSQKLFFKDFVIKLLWGFINKTDSLRQLSLELKTNESCKDLELNYTPFSTLKDGFSRFKSTHFKVLFEELLSELPLMKLSNIDEMGVFRVIDGTLLPTLLKMNWTYYRKKSNAFKMHLSFELNRMIPTEFLIKTGDSCERTSLLSMVIEGITYIADRGYFSFEVCNQIMQKNAHFIIRCKENALFTTTQSLDTYQDNIPNCFKKISDSVVNFNNDPYQNTIRLIRFQVYDNWFFIVTNRFDLTTLQIIILYAYRWQIELFFKYLKRTMNGTVRRCDSSFQSF